MKPMNVEPKQELIELDQLGLPVVDLALKTEKSLEDDPDQTRFPGPFTSGMF